MGLLTFRLRMCLGLLVLVLSMGTTAGCKQGPWNLWDAYAAHFIDPQGRVIDPQTGSRTTSEGQAYALFFALVDNDRARFDKVLSWTKANLAQGDLGAHLPAWSWGKDKDGSWKTLDANPASDADVWIAYTLVEAGRLWKQPNYTQTGRQMMSMIAQTEVADLPGFGPMLIPGPIGFAHNGTWTLNPSYEPLFLFERFASIDPAGPWRKIALGIPPLLDQSSRKGFAMDWVNYVSGGGFYPATEHPDKDAEPPTGSYDAIRVYLWAGMIDGGGDARDNILNALPSMSVYLANHEAPPEKVSDLGIPSGNDGSVGFSAAILPYLKAIPGNERAIAHQLARMSAQKDSATGLYGRDLRYYDQNLILFATGFLDGRFSFGPGGELKVEWTQ